MHWRYRSAFALAAFGALLVSSEGHAQGVSTAVAPSNVTHAAVIDYWTPQRLANARPIVLSPSVDPVPRFSAVQPSHAVVVSSPGAPPTVKLALEPETVIEPPSAQVPQSNIGPLMTSSSGYYFTTHRVPSPQTAGYPYIAVGQLFFHNPRTGQDLVCTASVIRPRLLSTAGHCVAHPDLNAANRYFYNNFLFIPARNGNNNPFGKWSWAFVVVANAWYVSNGSVPNPQDVALIEVKDSGGRKISALTGYLGYATGGLAPNHMTTIGYPCNLDSCTQMERNDAQSFAASNNNAVIGSAMRGGASGGPWIQDFGVKPTSNPAISGLGGNFQRGNSSYGPTATEPKYLGASIWDSRWVAIRNTACAHRAGNC